MQVKEHSPKSLRFPRRGGYLCCFTVCLLVASIAVICPPHLYGQTSHWYHLEREFAVVEADDLGSLHGIADFADQLTNIVKGYPIRTNSISSTEHEGVAWGYESPEDAWDGVLESYLSRTNEYPSRMFDDVGWVKGTHHAHGSWGAYMWLMQNTVDFNSSTTLVYTSPAGAETMIGEVLVGTMGDYPPESHVVDSTPDFSLEREAFPGPNASTNARYRFDTTAYYRLGLTPRLVPDFNHDRSIDFNDERQATVSHPFRFWRNDDSDIGDIAIDDSDLPIDIGAFIHTIANCERDQVYGRCDLLDFFPVWVDLHGTLDVLPVSGGAEYKLRHDGDAVKFVYTDLTRSQAGSFLTTEGSTYGPTFSQNAYEADKEEVTSSGIALNSEFLDRIAANADKGILMIEGAESSTSPLVLEVWQDGMAICETELPMEISTVEKMYRWINVRGAANGAISRSTDTSEPDNLPNSYSNGKNFIFVHGYSVHEEGARAWSSEIFKRLYQAGSRAKFTAVTWYGNEGQASEWVPFVGGSTPDYYSNVENAFQTAGPLESLISASPGLSGTKYIAGHSLGNMLVSSAIKDHGLSVTTYFMLNAAVAMETYDPEANHRDDMRHPNWQGYTNHNLWASDWHKLFASPPGDSRNKLSWENYFGTMSNGRNYFSSTEDVLDNANGNVPSLGKERAWVNQEMRKGTTLIWLGPGNAEAGWGFSDDYEDLTVAEANALPNSAIRVNSFFLHFDDEELYDPATGSAFLLDGHSDVRDSDIYRRLLADAIPALSNPAGRNPLGNAVQADVDYMSHRRGAYPSGWPRDDERWWHSDLKNIAYPYNRSIFDKIVTDGSLK